MLSIIVAAAKNGVIGCNGQLPWHISADLRLFRKLTTGHSIIMGRKTYVSIGRPLPERRSIVLSRNSEFMADGVEVVADFNEALKRTEEARRGRPQRHSQGVGEEATLPRCRKAQCLSNGQ